MAASDAPPHTVPTRRSHPVRWIGVAVLVVAVAGSGWAVWRSLPRVATVELAGLDVPVQDVEPDRMVGPVPVYAGDRGEPPAFSPEGVEVPLLRMSNHNPPRDLLLGDPSQPVVYVGEVPEGSAYLRPHPGAPVLTAAEEVAGTSPLDRLRTFLLGDREPPGAVCRIVADLQTCDAVPFNELNPVGPRPHLGVPDNNLWWPALPSSASVVTAAAGSTTLWQRPSARTVIFPLDRLDGEIQLHVLDRQGRLLDSAVWSP